MINLKDARIARLTKSKINFEVLVDPEVAKKTRNLKEIDFDDLVASDEIFCDVKKGKLASDLKTYFPNKTKEEIIFEIVSKGEIQYTQKELNSMREKLRNKVIHKINSSVIDAQTKLPIPTTRIEMLLEEINFHVDVNKSVEKLMEEAIKKLRPLIPISTESKKLRVCVTHQFASGVNNILRKKCKILSQTWSDDGSFCADLGISAGGYVDLVSELNRLTKGFIEITDL